MACTNRFVQEGLQTAIAFTCCFTLHRFGDDIDSALGAWCE